MANMILETGCFRTEGGQECMPSGPGALLISEKTIRKRGKLPIVFVCVLQNAPQRAGELWQNWFRERALACCERGGAESCVDMVLADFEECFAEHFAKHSEMCPADLEQWSTVSLAALFVMGEECFFAWRGSADIRLLNDFFGRVHMKRLAPRSETLCGRRARMEPGVGVLLGGNAFFDCLPEPLLKECLAVRGGGEENRTARRLEEAGREAQRRGADCFAAAMVVTRPEQQEEFGELLEREGFRNAALVGSGAFGRVYRVRERQGGRLLACKLAEGPRARALLRREAGLQEALEHPLFASYAGLAEGENITALFMEYVRGRDLDEILRRGPLPRQQAADIAGQLAAGLLYLHEREEPIVYRDLKPGNIRVNGRGSVKLLDLGCACPLTEAGRTKAGSRGYAAPEQLDGESGIGESLGAAHGARCGMSSDIYAWGRVLEAMLGGRHNAPSLAPLIEECIREDPRERPRSMRDVLKKL